MRLTFLPALIISLCALSHAQSGSAAGGAQGQQRRQAYLKFIEAQRLKEEAQRLRSAKVLEDAIAAYKETIRLDPASAEPHVDLGELYFFYQTRRDLAQQEAQEAIRIDSNSVGGHLLLARLLVSALKMENNPRSLNLDRTIREYEKVVELDSRQTEAWALLAELYQLKNDTERRVFALEKWAGSPIPGDAFFYRWMTNNELASEQAWFQLSDIYLGRGKYQQAVDAARRAYEANPESDEYARNLVSILMSQAAALTN
ncbi:MAG: tetratricopeptide repeat protein [Acidobacteria bacterium]|nr:tetratricopeptide repeat protein [Acidobacteriota bacterium]